jgi:hypothetical protein
MIQAPDLDKHTCFDILGLTNMLITESVHYGFVMFYSTGHKTKFKMARIDI